MSGDGFARRPLTLADVAAWERLERRLVAAEGREEAWSAEELAEELGTSWARPETRSRALVRSDGELAGLVWVDARPGAVRALARLEVDPDAPPGAGRALLGWAIATARSERSAGTLDAEVIEVITLPQQRDIAALLAEAGFRPARHWHELVRDLAEPIAPRPAPPGSSIVAWDVSRSEQVRQAHIDAFRDHWGSSPPTVEDWAARTTGVEAVPELHRLALADDEVVGYLVAAAYPQDWELKGIRDAWVSILGTRRAWRGRGVASALLAAAMGAMRDAGHSHVSLGVDSQSRTGATRLYAAHGFRHRLTRTSHQLPLD